MLGAGLLKSLELLLLSPFATPSSSFRADGWKRPPPEEEERTLRADGIDGSSSGRGERGGEANTGGVVEREELGEVPSPTSEGGGLIELGEATEWSPDILAVDEGEVNEVSPVALPGALVEPRGEGSQESAQQHA